VTGIEGRQPVLPRQDAPQDAARGGRPGLERVPQEAGRAEGDPRHPLERRKPIFKKIERMTLTMR